MAANIVLFFYKTYKQWEDFEKEIKYNNRYFPQSELLDEIRRIQNYAVCEIKQGDIFYGKNIVLFDTNKQLDTDCKNYEIIESKVYSITKLDLDY